MGGPVLTAPQPLVQHGGRRGERVVLPHVRARRHDVYRHAHGSKTLHHPVVGEITFSYESLTVDGDQDVSMALHTVEPGSPSEQNLRLLVSWNLTQQPSDVAH